MTQGWIQRAFAPIRRYGPAWLTSPLRRCATAILTPVLFSYQTGHFRSSISARAVQSDGEPLPWYTYPAIDFLKARSFAGKRVLEFGAGQSTLWWAHRAKHVLSFEGDPEWYGHLRNSAPQNVELHLVSMHSAAACLEDVDAVLRTKGDARYDVIVVDGLYRREAAEIAAAYMAEDGILICDNAEGYGIHEVFKASGLHRVDFCGYAPGVISAHVTAIYFNPGAFVFAAAHPIGS